MTHAWQRLLAIRHPLISTSLHTFLRMNNSQPLVWLISRIGRDTRLCEKHVNIQRAVSLHILQHTEQQPAFQSQPRSDMTPSTNLGYLNWTTERACSVTVLTVTPAAVLDILLKPKQSRLIAEIREAFALCEIHMKVLESSTQVVSKIN